MGTGFSKKKKQARMLQEKFSQLQNQMQTTEVTGLAGNGLVAITLTGDNEMKQIKIKPECVDPEDIEGLQDLIKAAYSDAIKQIKAQSPDLPQGLPDLEMLGM